MGVRLYVEETDVLAKTMIMSKVFGQPVYLGHLDKYAEVMASKPPFLAPIEEQDAWWHNLFQDSLMAQMNEYHLFGLGGLASTSAGAIRGLGYSVIAGNTSDPREVQLILAAAGWSHLIPFVQSVSWN